MHNEDFFANEMSEDLLPILQRHGYAEFVAYDPEKHGEVDAETGDMIWHFTDAMRELAARAEAKHGE